MTKLARLAEVIADPNTMSVIVQRVTDAEEPQTLREIAKSWQVPLGRLAEWITEDRERSEQYANALKIAAEQAALEAVRIADDCAEEVAAVQKAKLRVATRQWLAGKLAREKFGEAVEHKHTGTVSLIAVLSGIPRGKVIDLPAEKPAAEVPKAIRQQMEEI